ncbi:DUF4113 domain-containing protein, partial [Klebsiella pneumoniae]
NTYDLFVGKTLLHGDVLMWLMKTLLTSRCINQRGAGHFDDNAPRKNSEKLMEVLDHLNAKDGRGTLYFAGQGIQTAWQMKREMLSPRYTTRYSDLIKIR